MLANVVFARKLRIELEKPKIKLSHLAHYFSMQSSSKTGLPKPIADLLEMGNKFISFCKYDFNEAFKRKTINVFWPLWSLSH